MLHQAHFGSKGGKRTFAANANLLGKTPEADLQPAATTHFVPTIFSFMDQDDTRRNFIGTIKIDEVSQVSMKSICNLDSDAGSLQTQK
jgi:hypothetical protein